MAVHALPLPDVTLNDCNALQDKQAESLKERLVGRLALSGPREWRTVAWCIGQLGYSEKGMRRIIELTPSYRHALAEQQVRMREVLWGKRSCKVL